MSSSVKDLTRLFEPSINDIEESVSKPPSIKEKSGRLECQRQVHIGQDQSDEHINDVVTAEPVPAADDSAPGPSTGTETSQSTSQTNTSGSRDETSPSENENSQSTHADGESSDSSTCQLQALQRSPPISPPVSIRPLGNLNGNMQMFLDHSEGTEAGHSRLIEGKKYDFEPNIKLFYFSEMKPGVYFLQQSSLEAVKRFISGIMAKYRTYSLKDIHTYHYNGSVMVLVVPLVSISTD